MKEIKSSYWKLVIGRMSGSKVGRGVVVDCSEINTDQAV